MGFLKVVIAFLLIAFMEMWADRMDTKDKNLTEIAMCILFGAWVLREGW